MKDEGLLAIVEALPSCPGPATLGRLCLKKTGMTDRAAEALGRALAGTVQEAGDAPKHCAVTVSAWSLRRISLECKLHLAMHDLHIHTSVACSFPQDLDVSFNAGITPPGAKALARGVGASTAVSRLDLSRVHSVGAVARTFGESLSYCRTLSSLFLAGCKLTAPQLADLATGGCGHIKLFNAFACARERALPFELPRLPAAAPVTSSSNRSCFCAAHALCRPRPLRRTNAPGPAGEPAGRCRACTSVAAEGLQAPSLPALGW